MTETPPDSTALRHDAGVAHGRDTAVFPPPRTTGLTPEGAAALEAAASLARDASASATLRAYKADWTHFSQWCAAKGFVPVPAAPEVVGAYLASLAETHRPATIRRRLSALGKMHRYNDLPWNAAHGAIQGPLQGLLRRHGRPPQKAAALSLVLLRKLLATCDRTARGRRDRALLLFGFAGALRRSELVALQVEDVRVDADGLRLRILRGKTDPEGQGAEIGLPRGRHAETCPLRAFEAWQAVAQRTAGPLFRKISTAGRIGGAALHPDVVRRILLHRVQMAGLTPEEAGPGFDRLSAHALRVGFITEAYAKGVRDEDVRALMNLPCFALVPELTSHELRSVPIEEFVLRRPLTTYAEQIRAVRAGLWQGVERPG